MLLSFLFSGYILRFGIVGVGSVDPRHTFDSWQIGLRMVLALVMRFDSVLGSVAHYDAFQWTIINCNESFVLLLTNGILCRLNDKQTIKLYQKNKLDLAF